MGLDSARFIFPALMGSDGAEDKIMYKLQEHVVFSVKG